jgi:2-polyprenyl-6-methoxyphenol hydroxylase-like FAD-dependent oxidoreductase
VDLRFGAALIGVDDRGDRVVVTLDDGATLEADLLVGADGIHSTVRHLVFGDESKFLRYLGFHTAAFVFDAPQIRAASDGQFILTDTVGREMGFYSLRDGRVASCAVRCCARPDGARRRPPAGRATRGTVNVSAITAGMPAITGLRSDYSGRRSTLITPALATHTRC